MNDSDAELALICAIQIEETGRNSTSMRELVAAIRLELGWCGVSLAVGKVLVGLRTIASEDYNSETTEIAAEIYTRWRK